MKIIIIFLFAFSVAISQNVEPFQRQFKLNKTWQYLSSDSSDFQSSSFILGWHWGDQPKITKSLLMNQSDVNTNDTKDTTGGKDTIPEGTLLFIRALLDTGSNKKVNL